MKTGVQNTQAQLELISMELCKVRYEMENYQPVAIKRSQRFGEGYATLLAKARFRYESQPFAVALLAYSWTVGGDVKKKLLVTVPLADSLKMSEKTTSKHCPPLEVYQTMAIDCLRPHLKGDARKLPDIMEWEFKKSLLRWYISLEVYRKRAAGEFFPHH